MGLRKILEVPKGSYLYIEGPNSIGVECDCEDNAQMPGEPPKGMGIKKAKKLKAKAKKRSKRTR